VPTQRASLAATANWYGMSSMYVAENWDTEVAPPEDSHSEWVGGCPSYWLLSRIGATQPERDARTCGIDSVNDLVVGLRHEQPERKNGRGVGGWSDCRV
jgi:hypothetical protein